VGWPDADEPLIRVRIDGQVRDVDLLVRRVGRDLVATRIVAEWDGRFWAVDMETGDWELDMPRTP
jgi:hypothetical protein